jgi:hypothetical protein
MVEPFSPLNREERGASITFLYDAIISQNEDKAALQGLEILHRLMSNILKNPNEDKYRAIKRSVAKIEATLFSLQGGVPALLTTIGFEEIESGVFVYVDSDFAMINRATLLLDDALDPLRLKFMAPEDAEKHKILMQRKADMAAKRKAEAEKHAAIKKQAEND